MQFCALVFTDFFNVFILKVFRSCPRKLSFDSADLCLLLIIYDNLVPRYDVFTLCMYMQEYSV